MRASRSDPVEFDIGNGPFAGTVFVFRPGFSGTNVKDQTLHCHSSAPADVLVDSCVMHHVGSSRFRKQRRTGLADELATEFGAACRYGNEEPVVAGRAVAEQVRWSNDELQGRLATSTFSRFDRIRGLSGLNPIWRTTL